MREQAGKMNGNEIRKEEGRKDNKENKGKERTAAVFLTSQVEMI